MEKEDGSARRRYQVEKGQEGLVRWFAENGTEGSEVFRRCVVEGLPPPGVFEVREGNTRSDTECPGTEDGGLTQERELAEDLERGLLEDIVGQRRAGETGDIAPQWRIGFSKKLFQCGPVAGLGEKDQERLVGRRGLLCLP